MWPNPMETADLVTSTEEVFNGKLHFLRSVQAERRRWDSFSTYWEVTPAPMDFSRITSIFE